MPEHKIVCLDDAATSDIHQVTPENISGEEDLTRAPLKRAGVERVAAQPDLSRSQLLDVLHSDVDVTPPDANL